MATDHLELDVRVAHAWQLGWLSLAAQVQAGGALLHQRFTTEGVAPARTTGAAFFGAGSSLAVALGRAASASLAVEVNSFVLRRADHMTSAMDSTLSVGAVLAFGVAL